MPCTGAVAAAIIAGLACFRPVPGMIMKYRVLFFACLSALALAGCGQKGPLYLPVKPPAAPAAETAPAADASTAASGAATTTDTTTDTTQAKDKKKDATSQPAAPAAQP